MCLFCGWEKTNGKIEKLIEKRNRYQWAFSTLGGIYRTIKKAMHVTPNQQRAIENIELAGKRQRRVI